MDSEERLHPNHEAIPPDEPPAASPTLNAPPRVPKRPPWGWVALLVAICVVAVLYRWH